MQKNYILSSQLSDAGIVFITSNDPISRIIISITKQEFSSIGFYYKTSSTGIPQIRIITVDIFGVRTPDWLIPGDTIYDLINNPLISQIAVKKLKPILFPDGSVDKEKTSQLHTNFRTALAQVMGMKNEMSMRDSIAQLFGYPLNTSMCGQTAIDMVNRVIYLIGRWNDVPPNDSISLESLDLLHPPDHDQLKFNSKVQLMGYLSSTLNSVPVTNPDSQYRQIQSYIVSNNLLDELLYLTLPVYSDVKKEKALSESIIFYRPYLTRAISTFIDMLLTDYEFFKIVIDGIARGKIKDDIDYSILKNYIKDLYHSNYYSLSKIHDSLVKCHIPLDLLHNLYQSFISNNQNLKLIFPDDSSLSSPSFSSVSSDKIILLSDNPTVFNSALTYLHSQLQNALLSIDSGQMLYFDLNSLISSVNSLTNMSNLNLSQLPLPNSETSYSAIVSTSKNNNENIPITLSSGNKMIIPLNNPDLSQLSREILFDILSSLESLPYLDHKYDVLRSKISSLLSSK